MRFDDLEAVERADRDDDAETRADIVRYRTELGLPVDDATVAHFLAEFKAERHHGGQWLTEAEAEEHDRVHAPIQETHEVVMPYVEKHRADFAGWGMGSGRGEYNVGFARNVDAHREALMALVPRPEILRVHACEFTKAELTAIAERIADEAEELAAEGVTWMGTSVGGRTNRVRVDVAAADAATAAEILARRYGPAATCNWIGVKDYSVRQEPWQLWTADESERQLTVHYTTFRAFKLDRAECREDEHEVRVTVFVRAPHAYKTIGAAFEATVELSAPLCGRRVVDGTTGSERDRRVPKEAFDRSWELIRAYGERHSHEYGGSWAEHPGCHVAFTARLDAHREALAEMLPEPRVLAVHQVERSAAELEALKQRIDRDKRLLRGEGIRLYDEAHVWIEDNVVFVEAETKDGAAARRFLADRYGPGVELSC
jgi:hypothetical protein